MGPMGRSGSEYRVFQINLKAVNYIIILHARSGIYYNNINIFIMPTYII